MKSRWCLLTLAPSLHSRGAAAAAGPRYFGSAPGLFRQHPPPAWIAGSSPLPFHQRSVKGWRPVNHHEFATAPTASQTQDGDPPDFDVLFVGTGQSTAMPLLKHILEGNCPICTDAMRPDSKNRRNIVSIAIIKRRRRRSRPKDQESCILIDCGKTFRDGLLQLFPQHGLKTVSSLLLTHGHADAILGLDDIRDVQHYEQVHPAGVRYLSGPLQVYLHDHTFEVIKSRFDYLTTPPPYLDKEKGILERPVSYLNFNVVDVNADLVVDGVPIRCFPVWHGGDYISLGFNFGAQGDFVYISDVKSFPPTTLTYLKSLKIKTLVLDCLQHAPRSFSHLTQEEALALVDELHPAE